jgi:cysteine-rich repeat protein
VACGGSGGGDDHQTPMDAPTTHAVCGDGIIDVATETCDDGNTTSGDGCSSTCQIETVNKCGNGQIDGAETCDDGNQAGSDGCSAQCTVEPGYMCTGTPSVCTLMTAAMGTCANPMAVTLTASGTLYNGTGAGDTTNATNQVAGGMCDDLDSSGGGPDQIWMFVNPVAQPVLITLHPNGASFDGVLRMTTTACDVSTEVPDDVLPGDDGESDGCSDTGGSMGVERLNYNNLAAGTYYIVVDGYSDDPTDLDFGPYTFDIEAGHGTCGNGTIEFGESCDDHNTATGDGCDDTCHVETGYTCTGAPSVCTVNCGNGVLDDGETCDDHNQTANDGCSATCQVEPGHGTCAVPLNLVLAPHGAGYIGTGISDTTTSTDQVHAAACDTDASPVGDGPDHVWKFVNPVAQPVLISLDGDLTDFDGVLRMTHTACNVTTEVPDDLLPDDIADGASDGCADLTMFGNERLNYNMLPAGTYYITVDGSTVDDFGTYSFTVAAGNTTVCGDGTITATEECDSSGGHDICDATCHLVFDTTDTEANNTGAAAQVITPVSHIIEGTLPIGDRDIYKVTLTAPSTLELETYTSFATNYIASSTTSPMTHFECNSADTELRVFAGTADPSMDTGYLYYNDDGGEGSCSYIAPTSVLPAGTYFVEVNEYNEDSAVSRYLIDFKVTPM